MQRSSICPASIEGVKTRQTRDNHGKALRMTSSLLPAAGGPALHAGPAQCVLDARAQLGEGALWSPRRRALWWVDILSHRLFRWRPADGEALCWQFDEEVSAVAERRDGAGLMLALRRGMAHFDPDAPGSGPVYLHRPAGEPASNRFNDGRCDRHGRFWAGSMDFDARQPTGHLYCYDEAGRCERLLLGLRVTNGPAWSLDGRRMYVNDTVGRHVLACEVDPVSGPRVPLRPWLTFSAGDGHPDGMTVDADGRLWIAHWGGGCVSAHDPDTGEELDRIAVPASQVTHCAFGGEDLRTLYITTARVGLDDAALRGEPLAGGLFAVPMNVAGLPAHAFGVAA